MLRCFEDVNFTSTCRELGLLVDPPRAILTCNLQYKMNILTCQCLSLLSQDAQEEFLRPNTGFIWAPRGTQKRPKSALQIDGRTPFFGFHVGNPWKTNLGASCDPFSAHLGLILGHFEDILVHLGAILGPSWAFLGPSWAMLGPW